MRHRQYILLVIAVTTIVCVALAARNPSTDVIMLAALAVNQFLSRVGAHQTGRDAEAAAKEAKQAATQTNGELDERITAAVMHGNRRLIERLDALEVWRRRVEDPPPPPAKGS